MAWLKVRDRGAYVRLTGVLFLVFAANGLTIPLFANYLQKSLGAEIWQIGLMLTAFQVASLASQYWWGRRSDRLGRRKPLVQFGTAGLALALLTVATANGYEVVFATRVLEGLAFAAYSTGSLALIGDLLEDQQARGRMMGMYRMVGSLAFAATALAGGWLADAYSLRVPLYCAAGCYALAFLLVSSTREQQVAPPLPAHPAAEEPADEQHATDWRVLGPFLGLTFAWFLGMGSVVSLWPIFMSGEGYSQTEISGLWALAAGGEVIWLFVAGVLADRIGRKTVIITGVAGMACIYVAYTFAQGFVWFIPIQIIRSLTYSSFETPALLYATELGLRKQRGRLAGLYYSASGLGGIVGSAIGSHAAGLLGMPAMFRGVAAVLLLAALVAAIVMPGRAAALARARAPAEHPR